MTVSVVSSVGRVPVSPLLPMEKLCIFVTILIDAGMEPVKLLPSSFSDLSKGDDEYSGSYTFAANTIARMPQPQSYARFELKAGRDPVSKLLLASRSLEMVPTNGDGVNVRHLRVI